MIVSARQRPPLSLNYRPAGLGLRYRIIERRLPRGLGMDYYGLLAQAGLQNCDPKDVACVSNNVAKQAAVEDLWVTKYMTQPGGAPDDLQLTFEPQTAAQVLEFSNPNPRVGGNVVDTRGIMTVEAPAPPVYQQPAQQQTVQTVSTPTAAKSQSPAATTPGGKAIVQSSAVPSETVTPGTVAGFDLSSIPWWGWLVGGGALLFMFKGGR